MFLTSSDSLGNENETLRAKGEKDLQKQPQKAQKFESITTLSITSMSVDFVTQPKLKYNLQKVKSFRHQLTLSDPDSVRKFNKFKKILDDFKKNSTFAPPSDDMVVILNQSLNKLTANVDVIHKFSEKIIHSYFFGTEKFILQFAEFIITSAVNQTAFVQIYTRFLQEIYIGLPTKEQKDLLMNQMSKILFDSPEKSIGKSFFIGCLLSAQLIDYKPVFELVKNMLKMKETDVYEALFNLLIFAGPVLDEKCNDFEEDVVNELITAACNTDIKQRIRFLLSDLLDAREDNWNVSGLLQNIIQIQETSKIQKQQSEMKAKQSKSKKTQKVPIHSFNPLHVNDNENDAKEKDGGKNTQEDDEDDEFNYDNSLLKAYILDHSLPRIWNKRCTVNIMVSLELSTMAEYEKGIMIFDELKDDKDFLSTCIECLNEAKKRVNHPKIISEFPYCVTTVGSIFAQLVTTCGIDPKIIGTDSFPFELSVFGGFVDELARIDRLDILENNDYFTTIKFKPQIFPHSQLLNELRDMNLTYIFPVYDVMNTLFHMIEEEKPKEEIKKFINNDLDAKMAKDPMFIEFLTEIIVIQRPAKCQCLLEFMARRPMETLAHIESLGEFYKWKPQQTAALIRKVSELIHADLNEFKKIELRPFHKTVINYLPSE